AMGPEVDYIALGPHLVADEQRTDQPRPGPRRVPEPGAAGRPPPRRPPAVPGHRPPSQSPCLRGGLPRLGQGRPLDPRPTLAAVRRRRLEQVGLGVELADQRHTEAVAVTEPGDLVRAVARVAHEDQAAV